MIDVSHKLIRTDTVYTIMGQMMGRSQNPAMEFKKKFVGQIVMTKYNNKTYKIDDVDMEQNPKSTFDKNGTPITYIQYFREAYGIDIKDQVQPLLLHRAKPREQRARRQEGQQAEPEVQNIYLIPELCYLTGLSDEMKADFRVMKDIADPASPHILRHCPQLTLSGFMALHQLEAE